jgi:insertion element IS1 protein InsB
MWEKKTQKLWLWSALNREEREVVAWVLGDRDHFTFAKLWSQVEGIDCDRYMTDYWEAYEAFLPKKKHRQTKKETHIIESYHSWIRHYLARFHRRTHCYSKKEYMVQASLLLLAHKRFLKGLRG